MKTRQLLQIMMVIACLVGWTACSDNDKVLSEWEETEKENKPNVIDTKEEPVALEIINGRVLNDYFIESITFDQEGNAWIGTLKQGLIKYNGREATFFDSSNSPFSEDMVIWSVATDSKNNVWIGAEGLIRYDGEKFTTYTTANSPLPEDFVHSICLDSNDNLWFSSSRFKQGGLVCFDGNSQWKTFTPENSNMPGYSIHDIAINEKDEVWVTMGDYVNNASLVKVVIKKMRLFYISLFYKHLINRKSRIGNDLETSELLRSA
ncbi:hypothetical protein LJC57_08470 [Parabacteroides sp. OttesenSCG-928-G07]|nr:hypothetical protein [Parabacteroides sp. OttesenSCG-928-G21]MDL2278610.1 hypothetical protein [Parabacteroides sp. OttesenSCG-928-G07]